MEKNRVAVLGIVVNNREETSRKINNILSDFGHIIVGRMGIPYKEKGISVISIIVDGTNDEIGALAGKLGNINGVKAKVAITY
ncbi:MAG TPA: CopG family transcriptional regulator [Ruminiclostridium sp.]|jgi:putative iron-only hydrogenase system regulator|uniref:CopG family transcriptional regulator n=1 Tax=Acetivibrio saccincola TaxID=1677857 RepID=A0A2S8RCA1_9FIRM|nr:TM1266 family iron-only hydrogenase system putative regulator [Acetivibrio saccincola]HAA42582.1 CopG family transcriptional regulator [Ruminiclostridium sp.]NLW26982.1 CopG family transcriptional regulator [Acetivibrio saccincola]PQQ67423.1 CopG family transcriptional regulator [Acetivibrio saccincola]HOA97457.1 iron-only hydrogenase system regulator [Acetivibrio saccincola]HQD28782.1 iron-only hydrogenase system regulator [Acetivibrio saccincola]